MEKARPLLVGLSAIALLMVVFTGILLAMWYVPSSDALRSSDGTDQTIATSVRLLHNGPYTDTIAATVLTPQLAPASLGDPVISVAQSSIRVSINNAPFGQTLRRIHYWMSDVLLGLLTVLLAVLCLLRTYESDRTTWLRLFSLLLIALAGGWTGRILVDDVYAEISRRIMGHELSSAPLGGIIAALLGIEPGALLLARTYSVHGFLLGVLGLLMITPELRRILDDATRAPILSIGLLIAVGVSFVAVPNWGLRDAVRGLAGSEHVTAWWGIAPFRSWTQWLGSELAGYVGILLMAMLVTLPFWHRKMPPRTVALLLMLLLAMLLTGLLFGN